MSQRPNTIPCPRAFAELHPCDEMTPDGLLGPACTSALRHALKELGDLWPELEVDRSRQNVGESTGRRSTETPLAFGYDAAWTYEAVRMTVLTWIKDMAERHGEVIVQRPCRCRPPLKPCPGRVIRLEHDPGRTMREWCTWLLQRMHRIRMHPAVGQLFDELTDSLRAVKKSVYRDPEQTYVCQCVICQKPVFGPATAEEIPCRECLRVVDRDENGEPVGFIPVYARAEAEELRKEATRASLVPAGDLRTAIGYTEGIRVNRKTLHSWIRRDRLVAKGCRAYTWVSTLDEGRPRDVLTASWLPTDDGVQHELLYLVEDAIKLARDIPLRDLQAEEAEQQVEIIDHEAAYLKVLRVIQDAGGAA